jgi:hypothetical protein
MNLRLSSSLARQVFTLKEIHNRYYVNLAPIGSNFTTLAELTSNFPDVLKA